MNYRNLGKYGVKVSEVSLGSWLGFASETESEAAEQCIEKAYDLGINFFDTADGYAGGRAEEVVGKVLARYPRESFVLGTKVYFPQGSGPNDRGLSRKHIFEQCNRSLKRMGVEYIDLYQCHRYDTETPLEETLMALDDLARQGKILYAGVSMWLPAQVERAAAMVKSAGFHPIVSNQPGYNMLDRWIEKEVIPICEREGIGQVVYSPMAQGILSGKYKPGQPAPEGSRAGDSRQNMFLNKGNLDQNMLAAVQKLVPIAEEAGLSMAQLALAWCLRHKNVSSVIIGASRPSQIEDNVGAAGKSLSADVLAAIDEALDGHYSK